MAMTASAVSPEDAAMGHECPVCGAAVTRRLPASIAPFLTQRTGQEGPIWSNFCSSCEHVFFTPFLSSEQLAKLYTGYRMEAYNTERLAVEPSYAPHIEAFENKDSGMYHVRKDYYDQMVPQFRDITGVVVDFGGGDGYFSNYVFPNAEIIVADEDFERQGGNLDEALAKADLLFAAHVFEHVPHPHDLMARLAKPLRSGTQVFVELPKEYGGRLVDVIDSFTARMEAGDNPGTSLLYMHEHIAHFSKSSLKALLTRVGLTPIEYHQSNVGIFSILAVKN